MELKKEEVVCPECHGTGNRAKWDQIPDYKCYLKCDKCDGTGKMDWIEAVVGKKPKIRFKYHHNMPLMIKKESLIVTTNVT